MIGNACSELSLKDTSTVNYRNWSCFDDRLLHERVEKDIRRYADIEGKVVVVYIHDHIVGSEITRLINALHEHGVSLYQIKSDTKSDTGWGLQMSSDVSDTFISFGIFELIYSVLHRRYVCNWSSNNELK